MAGLDADSEQEDAKMLAYWKIHQSSLQQHLSETVDHVIQEQHAAPIVRIGQLLLESQGIDVASLNITPDRGELDMLSFLRQVVEEERKRAKSEKALSPASMSPGWRSPAAGGCSTPSAASEAFAWQIKDWVQSLNMVDILARALTQRLKTELDTDSIASECEHDFIRTLGDANSCEPIARLLHDSQLVDELAKEIHHGARKLNTTSADRTDGQAPGGQASKFFEEGSGRELVFGTLGTFYQGLDGFLGPPNPNLRETMHSEHCDGADARTPFRVPNYKTVTAPTTEFWFVVDPYARPASARAPRGAGCGWRTRLRLAHPPARRAASPFFAPARPPSALLFSCAPAR